MLRLFYRLSMLIGILMLMAGICLLVSMMTAFDFIPNRSQMVESIICQPGWKIEEENTRTSNGVGTNYYCLGPNGEEVAVNLEYLGLFFGLPTAIAVIGALGVALAILIKRLGGPGFDASPMTINLSKSG
jgi:hypothetical protein